MPSTAWSPGGASQGLFALAIKLLRLAADNCPMSHQEDIQAEVLNYFVANYCDLKDVVYTVEALIKKTATERNKAILREGCLMSILPLKDRHAFLVRIKLHEAMRL